MEVIPPLSRVRPWNATRDQGTPPAPPPLVPALRVAVTPEGQPSICPDPAPSSSRAALYLARGQQGWCIWGVSYF